MLLCQFLGCTHCVNSNDSSQENYSSHQTLYVLTLTLNKKRKMKILGRVARLILLVVVSVCVVFCVLCCLQNNPVVSSVTYLIISKMKIMSYVFRWVSSLLPGKNKVLVVCLAGCAVVSVFGSGDYDRKKKVLVVCLAGCAVVSVFGSGDYDRKKTKLQSSVWWVVLLF